MQSQYTGLDDKAQRWLERNNAKLPRMNAGKRHMVYANNQSLESLSTRQPSDVYVRGKFAIEISQDNPLENVKYGPPYPHLQWVHGVSA